MNTKWNRTLTCLALLIAIALATACGSGVGGPVDLGVADPDMSSSDAGVDSDAGDAGDIGPANLELCEAEPADWPERPRWGQITSGYPDYQDVMNNFNILDSLQLFASMITKAVSSLNSLSNAADEDATGYCMCNCTNPTPNWSQMPEEPSLLSNWAAAEMLPATCFTEIQTKEQCVTQCTGFPSFSTVMAIDSDDNHLWTTSDTFEKPNGDPRYALRLIKFIDQISGFLSAGGACMSDGDCNQDAVCANNECKSKLRQVLDAMSTVGANLTQKVQMIIAALEQVFEVINRFTEGYHLGGYSEQRPDLHMCVGYAGHGAYSQLANLSGDKLSIGARYTSHVVSHEGRVQFRTGGFGVSALGKSLSILPTPEANIQIDGWKVWNADKPFGIPFPTGGIDIADIEKYDIFDLVDENQVADLAGVDGIIQAGELVIVDYYPAVYVVSGTNHEWPRSMNDASNSWVPWTGWEGEAESKAVFSAGLNLPLEIEPLTLDLPTIPIYPPYASLTPYFSVGAGVEWIHDAFYLRNRIRDKINENIPNSVQVNNDDFAREMHALQAPDLSGDNGTTAYVQPELGATLSFGLQLAKWVALGINASIGVGARVQPGGFGGVVDLNYALVQALNQSNPPADAPCTPIYDENVSRSCSNEAWEESNETYACDGESVSGSCCIQVGDEKTCVESWMGIEQEFCEEPKGFAAGGSYVSDLQSWLNKLRLYAGNSAVNSLLDEVNDQVVVSTTWNGSASCARANCTGGITLPGVSSASECELSGYCADSNGTILAHDVSEDDCLGYNQAGPGRCCSSPDDGGGFTNVSCDVDQFECRGDNGIWVPGGICSSNVNPENCSNRDDERLGNTNLTWVPYDCLTQLEPEVVGWEGDGCHPLNQGFPSACGCTTTTDCATGETCNPDGQCENSGVTDCVCDPDDPNSCPTGRTCVDGGCALECTSDSDCRSSFECAQNACVPKHSIPTAESIIWGMQNGDEPVHAISTYAWSEILFLAYATFGLDLGLTVRIFGKSFELTLFDFAKVWDLGSTNKAWYQPGLEARYQDQCSDPAAQLVTNRQPAPVTSAPGVSIDTYGVADGYVARYPEPQNNQGMLDPEMEGNACHPGAGDCTWEDLVAWCQEDIPGNVVDPPEPNFDDLTDGLTDTVDWGEDIGLQLWDSGQVCVGGEPWYEYAQNVNGSLENLDCIYDGPNGTVTFPCAESPLELLEAFGCLDTNLNAFAQVLASNYGSTITTNGGAQFDAQAMMQDPQGEFAIYNIQPQYYFSGFMPTGIQWVNSVQACFETQLEIENRCECSVDADCESGDTCHPDGFCLNPDAQWSQCPVVRLANPPEPEPCCGDGVQQEFEECDDGNTVSGDGCSSYCTLEGDSERRGACCQRSADGLQCVEALNVEECRKVEPGTFYPGQTCSEVECG